MSHQSVADRFRPMIDELIAKNGCMIQWVASSDEDDDTLPFAYTIGNHLRGYPELLLIAGFHPAITAGILNHVNEAMVANGRPFKIGELVPITGTSGKERHLKIGGTTPNVRDEYTIQAGQYLGHEDYAVQQVLIPDDHDRFPTDLGCDAEYARQHRFHLQ